MSDPAYLLGAVADALNAAERAGLPVDNLADGIIWTAAGYVIPFGDPQPGRRWVVRARVECAGQAGPGGTL